jgi:hypothetical protein
MSIDNNNSSTSAQHPNKWLKWYHLFCESRKYRGIKKEKGYHIHHIIPVCDHGSDDPDNLVKLTHREHFIFHVLLAKGTDDPKHWCFVRRAIYGKGTGRGGSISYKPRLSILVTTLQQEAFSKSPGAAEKGRKKSKSMRDKLSKSKKGKRLPDETVKKAHEANRGRKQTDEEKQKRREAALKYWLDSDRSDLHREIAREHMKKLRSEQKG